jgi:hypothetical protein
VREIPLTSAGMVWPFGIGVGPIAAHAGPTVVNDPGADGEIAGPLVG